MYKGKEFNFEGKTLIIPSNSIGQAPLLGSDIHIYSN